MKMLLTPYLQHDLGVVILRPGRDLLHYFSGLSRLLVANEPVELQPLPSGVVPADRQQLATDPRLSSFFQQPRVIAAAGGVNSLVAWLERSYECQWHAADEDYHDKNMTTLRYGCGAVRLCWHHENILREQTIPALDTLVAQNVADFVVYRARAHFNFDENHQLTLPELCWWALLHDLVDLLPEDVAAASLRVKPHTVPAGTKKEADITHTPAAQEIVAQKASKAIKVLKIDPEPPQALMKIPKRSRWENPKYLQWVKSRPCVCCGARADDPHHIIGHGQGGMGTKAHDLLTIPLCRQHHNELHLDMVAWEQEHGSQVDLWYAFFDLSVALGAIA